LLPHSRPNAGVRLVAGGRTLAYTGDTGADDGVADLARDADLLLAEASFTDQVPEDLRGTLSSADLQGRQASAAGAGRLLLAHLMPGTDPAAARAAAGRGYHGDVGVATQGLVVEL
jgi:ribonuclease BN (tRNA processing enzyme)